MRTTGGAAPIRASSEADLERMARRARRADLFASLGRVYGELPETTCENCGRCCFESPGVFFVEHLRLVERLAAMPKPARASLILRAFRELFFAWIEPELTCIFLDGGRCSIYGDRPLACRLFGLAPAGDRETAEVQARLAAREEARRLRRFGIEVPEAVVTRALVSCDRVRDRRGAPSRVDGEAMAARVAHLDAALLPQAVVVEEFCFRSLPERLGAAAFGEGALEGLRLQLLRRAEAGQSVEDLLSLVLSQARLPAALVGRSPHKRR